MNARIILLFWPSLSWIWNTWVFQIRSKVNVLPFAYSQNSYCVILIIKSFQIKIRNVSRYRTVYCHFVYIILPDVCRCLFWRHDSPKFVSSWQLTCEKKVFSLTKITFSWTKISCIIERYYLVWKKCPIAQVQGYL